MLRLLFEKTGRAVWISHLDLMRLFQRAFQRSGLNLTHTQGFNPRPSVSIALPLSVGTASNCELLDFDLDGDMPEYTEICERLNRALIDGVRVLQVYDNGRKLKDLSLLSCEIMLEYDAGTGLEAAAAIRELFKQPSLCVEKKGKNGPVEQDIIPMIREFSVMDAQPHTVMLQAMVCCQNPSLNPVQIVAAIERYVPQFTPDYATTKRVEIFDAQKQIFR